MKLLIRALALAAIIVSAERHMAAQVGIICRANAGVAPIVRAEGVAELLGDYWLECTGGTPGVRVVGQLTTTLSTDLTSKRFGNFSEALLLIDEPNTLHFRPDGTSFPGPPLAPGINVLQAVASGTNSVSFPSVAFDAPGPGKNLILRVTNLRGDATKVPPSQLSGVRQIFATARFSAPGVYIIDSEKVVGYGNAGISSSAHAPGGGSLIFQQCTGHNTSLLTGASPSFYLRISEGFQTAFRRRYEELVSRYNVPGVVTNTETGFYDPSFPAANGMNLAGLGTQQNRLIARFSDVPAGVSLFIATTPTIVTNIPQTEVATFAQLTSADANGAGPFSPVAPTLFVNIDGKQVGLAPVQLVSGAGTVVWEVTGRPDPWSIQRVDFPVFLVYQAGAPSTGTGRVITSFGPFANGSVGVPRFQPSSRSIPAFTISPCPVVAPELTIIPPVSVSSAAGTTVPVSVTVRNTGSAAASPFRTRFRVDPIVSDVYGVVIETPARLAPGEATTVTANIEVTPWFSPTVGYYIAVEADFDAAVIETYEWNNYATIPLKITQCAYYFHTTEDVLPSGHRVPPPPISFDLWPETGCPVTATSDAAWLTPEFGVFRADVNTTSGVRYATGTVNGRRIKVAQMPQPPAQSCSVAIREWTSPVSAAAGERGSFDVVATTPDCQWTNVSAADWLQFFPLNGSGPGRVSFTLNPNFRSQPRWTRVFLANELRWITQESLGGTFNERLVQQAYFNFLGRLPSPSELALQVSQLNTGTPAAQLIERFFNSEEFNNGGRFIAGLYVGLLDRDAEYSGWLFQRNALAGGVVTQHSLVSNFLNSAEYKLKFGNPDDARFVQLLYRHILLREPSASEVAFHVAALKSGMTRVQVATNFLNTPEFRLGTGARLTAFLLYATVLNRDGSESEIVPLRTRITAGTGVRTLIQEFVGGTEFKGTLE